MRLTLRPARGKKLGEPTAPESRAPRGYFQYGGANGAEGVVWLPAHWLPDGTSAPFTLDVQLPDVDEDTWGPPSERREP